MTVRSQRHKEQTHGFQPPPVTGISPDTATVVAAGVIGRLVATLSATGGTPPFTYAVVNSGTLTLAVSGDFLNTGANPVGPVGAQPVSIKATDSYGRTLTENITVTVT